MYYEEQVIDGVLHWRGTPAGEWQSMTAERLTGMLMEARRNRPVFAPHPPLQPWPAPWAPPFVVTCDATGP